jgi:antitoxin (DNA-binding transcriptional repressor) of toxin-antitoxin stability system
MRFKATKLRANLYKVLDNVLNSGIPVEIDRRGKLLKIVPMKPKEKLDNLKSHPDYLAVEPESLVHVDWSKEWHP